MNKRIEFNKCSVKQLMDALSLFDESLIVRVDLGIGMCERFTLTKELLEPEDKENEFLNFF